MISDYECSHNTFFHQNFSIDELCRIAQNENCLLQSSYVNFFAFNYCQINGRWYLFIPLGIILFYLIFRFLGQIVEEYIAPAITYIKDWLKMSEALGAVTLLALANGTGDVMTAYTAATTPDGINLNIGALFGAGSVVTTAVVGFIILYAGPKGVSLAPTDVYKNIGLYLISTLLIIIFGEDGNLDLLEGIILLVVYFVFVLVVFLEDKYFPKNRQYKNIKVEDEYSLQSQFVENNNYEASTITEQVQNEQIQVYDEQQKQDFKDMSILDKIIFILDIPFMYVQKFTIVPTKSQEFQRIWIIQSIRHKRAAISITPGIILTTWIIWGWNWYQLYALFPIGIIISLIVYFTSPLEGLPKYYILLQIYGIFTALMWTVITSGILIDLLNFFGMITNLPEAYLGLTIIAMGNSVPDSLTTIALSKQGLSRMAMPGAFASQLFSLLVGLGLALIRLNTYPDKNKLYPDGNFPLFNWDNLVELIIMFYVVVTLCLTISYSIYKRFQYGKHYAYLMISLYTILFICVTGLSINQAIKDQ